MPARDPRPLKQHSAKTLFLRVPSEDWPGVSRGAVTEFRAAIGNVPQLWNVPMPTFVVAYRKRRATDDYDFKLMTLTGVRQERLIEITEEGLAAAGYTGEQAMALFRREWMDRNKRRFEPNRKVMVFTVRPVADGDLALTGRSLAHRLYGDFVDKQEGKA